MRSAGRDHWAARLWRVGQLLGGRSGGHRHDQRDLEHDRLHAADSRECSRSLPVFFRSLKAAAAQVPFLGFWLRAKTGSWLPQLVLAAGFKVASGTLYTRWASVTSARELLEAQKREED